MLDWHSCQIRFPRFHFIINSQKYSYQCKSATFVSTYPMSLVPHVLRAIHIYSCLPVSRFNVVMLCLTQVVLILTLLQNKHHQHCTFHSYIITTNITGLLTRCLIVSQKHVSPLHPPPRQFVNQCMTVTGFQNTVIVEVVKSIPFKL